MTSTVVNPTYTARAASTGEGRNGHVRSDDGILDFDLAVPKPGRPVTHTNPEQLFAAGYSACFHSALLGIARHERVSLGDATITAEVTLGQTEDGGFGLSVAIAAELSGVDQEQAERLVAAAHQACPYSRATRGNIDVTVTTTVR